MRSEAMEEAGIPCRQRKLILRWANKFRYVYWGIARTLSPTKFDRWL